MARTYLCPGPTRPQTTFEKFFLKHALTFTDDEEHKLEYMTIYKEFQALFDAFMEEFCEQEGVDSTEFMQKITESDGGDPRAAHYISIIIASG